LRNGRYRSVKTSQFHQLDAALRLRSSDKMKCEDIAFRVHLFNSPAPAFDAADNEQRKIPFLNAIIV
jgi:hypothetical protein